jgi:hypothetical protein
VTRDCGSQVNFLVEKLLGAASNIQHPTPVAVAP